MRFVNKIGKVCKIVYDKIQDKNFAEVSKMKEEDFTRNRKVGFAGTMLIALNKTGKGLTSTIRAYREAVKMETESYSKQAFSKGRMRIKWEAFREIHRITVEEFYKEFPYKTYCGYRVFAIDGTKLNLPYHEETIKEFGMQKSGGETPQALGSCLYDVLNGVISDALLAPHNGNERELAVQHLEYLSSIRTEKELLLLDRGYPSAALISGIEANGFHYLMRASNTFAVKLLKKATSDDCIITHKFKSSSKTFTLRLIQLHICDQSGHESTELLITNIFDKSFQAETFASLYHLRWGIESKYDDIKNKLQIENFSGITPLAIRQDFYATMFLSNLAAMIIFENEKELDQLHNNKQNKYQYKVNVNAVISLLKEKVILMLVTDSKLKSKQLMQQIQTELTNAVVPIRSDRSFPRSKKHFASKFPHNQKP